MLFKFGILITILHNNRGVYDYDWGVSRDYSDPSGT